MTDERSGIPDEKFERVASHFRIDGEFQRAHPHGNGHIHDTFASYFEPIDDGQGTVRYIHQRINEEVFPNVDQLMENIERVTTHVRQKVKEQGGDPDRNALTLVRTEDGEPYYVGEDGGSWRTYLFIEGARNIDVPEKPGHVYSAGKAFGTFQAMLTDLPGPSLHDTIPDFHHTEKRFERFLDVLDEDPENRAKQAGEEIQFLLDQEDQVSVLLDLKRAGALQERVTHNDTKLNNVMIDNETDEGVCVIDLDTVMNGLALYDYGDAIRTGASKVAEDERDLSKVGVNLDLFTSLTRGYLETAGSFLNEVERDHMVFSAELMTLEVGMRFLTDYLDGDNYFKIEREDHNLDRCRTQFEMARDIRAKREQMEAVID